MSTIKAIETHYNGYRFRSRLEARWAVFFDALGCDWEYEVEGFELSDGLRYLPDFRVGYKRGSEAQMYWAEVKPQSLTESERIKAEKFAREVGELILLVGTPAFITYPQLCFEEREGVYEDDIILGEHKHRGRFFTSTGCKPLLPIDPTMITDPERIRAAVEAARSARFEFGETPK